MGNVRRALRVLLLVVATVGAAPPSASGQGHGHRRPEPGHAAAAFLAAARAGTARYRDLAAAIADGYRRIGGDLPSMGEHWVNTGLVVRDTLAPEAPPVLIYARVQGAAVLAGAAYIRILARDDPYPLLPRRGAARLA